MRKLTLKEMQDTALTRGGRCLSKKYVNSQTKLRWRCKEGHIWEATPGTIRQGSWCLKCGNAKMGEARKLTIEEMQDIARKRGGKCLSKNYVNSWTKLRWKCKKGHIWEAAPNNIKHGTWCPVCNYNKVGVKTRKKTRRAQKLTIEDMQDLAKSRGGKCLSKKYINSLTKLKWMCGEGHVWEAIPSSIKQGTWCPVCNNAKKREALKLTIEEMQDIARERGGRCLSKNYVNSWTKLRWRCKEGHIWEATPNSIKRGSWCSLCRYNKIRDIRRLTIKEVQKIAKKRGGKCLSKEYENIRTKLKWKCKDGHEWKAPTINVKRGSWCPICGHIKAADARRMTIKEMQNIAKERGGKCLSKKYTDTNTKLKWRCKEGHEWKATPGGIKRGSWCPKCYQNKIRETQRLIFKKLQEIAQGRGGKCLSKKYVNKNTRLKFECKEGHRWEAIPRFVKEGSWCPICGRINRGKYRRLSIYQMHKLAKNRDGKCLSKKYVNSRTKLRWRCNEGHEWEATPNSIKRGSWCPTCRYIKMKDTRRMTIEEMQDIASKKDGKCLSINYLNRKTKLTWECKEGHVWEATPASVKFGSWCPKCSRFKKGLSIKGMQAIARERGGECLSQEYVDSKTKLRWRCKEGHEWEAIPNSIKQGAWCPTCFDNRIRETQTLLFEKIQNIAVKKGGKCLSKKYVNINTNLKWICSEGHIWTAKPNNINQGYWCPVCASIKRANVRKLTIEEMQDIARERGGECLSEKYINSRTKLRWRCKEGHEWEAKPNSIKHGGTWCSICSRNKRIRVPSK